MSKIAFLGAGSMVFSKTVLGDCMLIPSLQGFELAIHDIDLQRLKEAEKMLLAMKSTLGSDVTVKAYADRKEALRGADYVINSILAGGYDHIKFDMDIPKKYGLLQTIGDTLGIGGIFRGLRTARAMLEFAEDMQEVCPDALFLNYTNPMSILTHVMNTIGGIRTIGLCHSVQNCVPRLLNTLGMSNKNVSWKIAGINHMAWLLEVTQGGQDLYPEIKRRAEEKQAEQHLDRIRYEIMQRFGYFVTESSHHSAEYYPYFLKRSYPEFVEKYKVPLDKSLRNQEARAIMRRRRNRDLMKTNQMEHSRSNEYCSRIIEAIETNVPFKFAGNVLNTGLITNLPSEGCVEVACIADAAGIAPTYVGDLPPVCAALNRSHMNNQLLTIEAIKSRKKESVYQAAFLDPHASAELSLDDIVSVCDELFEAHGNVLPKFI